jgi:rod shape-determining protein MreB
MPKTVEITSDETIRAFKDSARRIMMGIRNVLEDTPPELAADIATRGILLTGGMSMLYGMDELIRKTTGIQTIAVDDPTTTVVIGTGRYAEFMEEKQARN